MVKNVSEWRGDMEWKDTVVRITREVRREIQKAGEAITDQRVAELTEELVLKDRELEEVDFRTRVRIVNQIFYTLRRDMGILEPLLKDDEISEIMVNGLDSIYIEKQGKTVKIPLAFTTTEELQEVIRRIGARVYREINERTPILDARLPDGSRVNAVYSNVALDGPVLTIRKFPERALTMENLIQGKTITREAAEFLKKLVLAGYNIFISGGTSSGKTTFLNILSDYIPREERIIVIEDSAELQLDRTRNLVRLECRNANAQGKGQVEMHQLIRTSLRMRPDRIVVGEVRGGEVVDMIQAMNTGHDGSLSTGHGNSTEGMLFRLESMFLQVADYPIPAVRGQIAEGIDLMVHLGRLTDQRRVVLEIAEVVGFEKERIALNKLFIYDVNKGLVATGNTMVNNRKLEMKGVAP
jgi:pilus assembly protein CpaF